MLIQELLIDCHKFPHPEASGLGDFVKLWASAEEQ